MSTSLLVRRPMTAAPSLIPAVRGQPIGASAELSSARSSLPRFLEYFELSSIRVTDGPALDPLAPEELALLPKERSRVAPSIRASALLFLALSMDHDAPAEIIIVSRLPRSVLGPISLDLQKFYPRALVSAYSSDAIDALYAAATAGPAPQTAATRYLLSLGTTPANHQALVKHFRPRHLLAGIQPTPHTGFAFYRGEAWIPPFTGRDGHVLYIRTPDLTDQEIDSLATSQGKRWDSHKLHTALLRHRLYTNEATAYFNPHTGTDTHLAPGLPNDYSHLFALAALHEFYAAFQDPPQDAEFLAALRVLTADA